MQSGNYRRVYIRYVKVNIIIVNKKENVILYLIERAEFTMMRCVEPLLYGEDEINMFYKIKMCEQLKHDMVLMQIQNHMDISFNGEIIIDFLQITQKVLFIQSKE